MNTKKLYQFFLRKNENASLIINFASIPQFSNKNTSKTTIIMCPAIEIYHTGSNCMGNVLVEEGVERKALKTETTPLIHEIHYESLVSHLIWL